uniref:Uncharacterized protein n=1 Tax=Glossina pallidipes TaxID=7398 RepID=A0A1B0A447_GLOPL
MLAISNASYSCISSAGSSGSGSRTGNGQRNKVLNGNGTLKSNQTCSSSNQPNEDNIEQQEQQEDTTLHGLNAFVCVYEHACAGNPYTIQILYGNFRVELVRDSDS